MDLIIAFLEAAALGALVGLEREVVSNRHARSDLDHQQSFGGLRSYTLIALLGALSVYISQLFNNNIGLLIFIGSATLLLITISYIYAAFVLGHIGTTSELAAIIVFVLGALVMSGAVHIAVFLGIVTTVILNFKSRIAPYLTKIGEEEIASTLTFATIALIVLPLLPNIRYSLHELFVFLPESDFTSLKFFNPYGIWLFVVIMSAVSYVGYVLSKVIGTHKSIILAGSLGGLVSSTAVTSAMSEKSREHDGEYLYPTVFATIVACTIMLVRIFGIVLIFHPMLLRTLVYPLSAMFFTSLLLILWLWKKNASRESSEVTNEFHESPFQVGPALKFAGFVACIKFLSIVALYYQNTIEHATNSIGQVIPFISHILTDLPTYLLAIFSGLADVDAITQQMAELSIPTDVQSISYSLATTAIIVALVTNTIVKIGIARKFGSKQYGAHIARILGIVGAVGLGVSMVVR